jgi:HAE1 family hydrophobic/amphiphilic exporter-1
MSLSGLALGVGMLVDNSIVVIESIFKFKEKGEHEAELKGTQDVAGAVFASTLTTVSVFFPLIFVHGIAGNIFKDQSLTVSFSLLCSYFVSVTLLPVVASMVFKERNANKLKSFEFPKWECKQLLLLPYCFLVYVLYVILYLLSCCSLLIGFIFRYLLRLFAAVFVLPMKVFNKFYESIFQIYHKLLCKSLDNKKTVLIFAFLFLLFGVFFGFMLKKEFFPKTKAEYLNFTVVLPKNAAISASDKLANNFEKYLKSIKGVGHVVTVIGVDPGDISSVNEEAGTNYINYNVKIEGDEDYLKEKILHYFNSRKSVAVTFKKAENEFAMLMKTGDLKIKFVSASRKEANALALKAKKALLKNKCVAEITDNFSETGSIGIKIKFKNNVLLKYGISGSALGDFIQTCIKGKIVSKLKLTDRNFGIRLRLAGNYRETVNQLLSTVFFADGKYLKLSSLIEVEQTVIPERLEREQQNPVAILNIVTVKGVNKAKFIRDALNKIEKLKTGESVIVEEGREMQEMRKSLTSLSYALILSFILVYLLLSAQFESFLLPFVIIFTFPMGLSGAFFTLGLLGMSLNVLSFVGLVILSGIVVNDAIVKVDCIHTKFKNNVPLRTAVLEASSERFRPIWMTTITTVFGMLPVFFIQGAGSDLLKPLAAVLIGGLLMATTLTLFLIPAIYEIIYGRNEF